jgi:hypothetical protein
LPDTTITTQSRWGRVVSLARSVPPFNDLSRFSFFFFFILLFSRHLFFDRGSYSADNEAPYRHPGWIERTKSQKGKLKKKPSE